MVFEPFSNHRAAFDILFIIDPYLVGILIGGLLLRQAVLICGALPTLNIGGFQFRRIARPKDPKPGIDTLPPQ